MKSLHARFFVVWLLSLAASVAVGGLLVQLYRQSNTAQVARAEAAVTQGCDRIADRYGFYATGWAGPPDDTVDARLRQDLITVVQVALAGLNGVEGGIWQQSDGPLAYAYPTYAGTGPKTDLPDAERPRIAEINAAAVQSERGEDAEYAAGTQTVVLRACPLAGPIPDLTGWTMARVTEVPGLDTLRLGLGVLLALVLGIAAWLTWLVLTWTRGAARIEAVLAHAPPEELPRLAPTGEDILDRVVGALNAAGVRLAEARQRQAELAARVAHAERLAALGRVAAGVAHEIRNPIAAMRLRAENALAGDPARRGAALEAILAQIARLDGLIAELLAMTQRREPVPETVDIPALLAATVADAHGSDVAVAIEAPPLLARLDPALLRRALDALLDNAIRHAAPGGRVTLRAATEGDRLHIEVADTGAGVPPELRATLFEPFVTGRAEGTGLGLAIARELVQAQGGRLTLACPGGERPGKGAVFAMEFPMEPKCRPS